jgi:O-antigen/teichoic acid export membrane protein
VLGEDLETERSGQRTGECQEFEHRAQIEAAEGRHTAGGVLRLMAVHASLLPVGLLTVAFMARQLGPELYGLFTVASSVVLWIESTISRAFNRSNVKFVAEAIEWQKVASALLQAQLMVSLVTAVLLLVMSPMIASWLKSQELTGYLWLFALDIPLFFLASAHVSMLTGRGAFGKVSFLTWIHGVSRMIFVFLLIGLGLSLTGAILATIGASFVQLIVARIYLRPAILNRVSIPVRRIAQYALPLFLYSMGMRLFVRLDLFIVKALSGTEAAGFYGAAQNLTIPFALFAASLTPILLATWTRVVHLGKVETVQSFVRQAIRVVFCLLPIAGLISGASSQIVELIYGHSFLPATPLLSFLIFGAVGNIMISLTEAALIASGRPGWVVTLTGPLLPLALIGHLLLIPRFGSIGAAVVTTTLSWLGASAMILAVYRKYNVYPSPLTVFRTLLTTLVIYTLSSILHTSGLWLILKLFGLTAAALTILFLLGELTGQDWLFVRSLLKHEEDR